MRSPHSPSFSRSIAFVSALLAAGPLAFGQEIASARSANWPQWRGPSRNGIAQEAAGIATKWEGKDNTPPLLWESESIPSNDEGGLSSPVAVGNRVFVSLVWHKDEPSETRQISELVVRQLGHQSTRALGKEIVAAMEETRLNLSPSLRGKALEEFSKKWVSEHLDKKQQQLYSGFVTNRFKKGKHALPLEVLEKLDSNSNTVFPSEAAMKTWLESQNWSPEIQATIVAAVPPTKRVAEDTALCLDATSGKTLWKFHASTEPSGRNSSSTPVAHGAHLYFLGSRDAYCVAQDTGKEVWRARLPAKGPGSSPLVVGDKLVVNSRGVVAFNIATGKEAWTQKDSGGGNSSPVVWTAKGDHSKTMIIVNGKAVDALDLDTGKIIWSVPGGGDSTPALEGDILATQTRKPAGGVICYRLRADGADQLWHLPIDALRTQSSPLIHDGLVYLVDDNTSWCFEATTGKQIWKRAAQSAITSPVLIDGKLIMLTNNGNTLTMQKAGREGGDELARATVRGTWCPSPAMAGSKILIRAKEGIKCFDLGAR